MYCPDANRLARGHGRGKVAAFVAQKIGVEETMSPSRIVDRSRCAVSLLPGASDVPSPQSASSLCSSAVRGLSGPGHVHAEAHTRNRRAGRDVSRDVECDHTPAEFTHDRLTGKEVHARALLVSPSVASYSYSVLSLLGMMTMIAAVAD